MPQFDPLLAAKRPAPTPLTAAIVIFVALAYPGPLIAGWTAFGPDVPAISALLTAYYLAQVVILGTFLAGWCLPRAPIMVRIGIVAASVIITALAVAVPSLLTYGLYYAATVVVCLILAVQQLGRAPLWPPRWRDAPLTLVPLPLILASMFAISAIATWVLNAPLKQEPTSQSSATGLLGTVAHIDTFPELLIRSVWTGIGEEAAAVLLVVGLTRRAVPLPMVYTIAALVRVTYHAQFSLAAVGLVILGVGMVWLWRRYERLLPLIAAHTLWDAIGGNHPEFLIGLTGAGLLTIIGFYTRSSVLKRSRRPKGDALNPGAPTSSADTVAS